MKKKITVLSLLALIICMSVSTFSGCRSMDSNPSSNGSYQEFSNPEHEDVELPEVERP